MTWYPHDTYDRARWQESRHRIAKVVQGQQPETLLELDDVQGRLALFQQSYVRNTVCIDYSLEELGFSHL